MSSPTTTEELLDLKLLPAWVTEPPRLNEYSHFEGEDERSFERGGQRPGGNRDRERRAPRSRDPRAPQSRDSRGPQSREQRPRRPGGPDRSGGRRPSEAPRGREEHREREVVKPIAVNVRFLPHPPPFNSVIAQIKSGSVAYSVFALARLFLEKPERYDVKLTVAEDHPLFQLGEHGAVASDRTILESGAFASARDDFYTVEVIQSEPLKGNFTNVARCRLSGTLLGPTNHHNYQPQLRSLYEARFSRRMSFFDYQKQVDIVSDPAVVEEWKEQARNVTTYTAKTGEPPATFTNPAEVERDFRKNHLPGLLRSATELTIGGVISRRLPDRALGRAIEDAWVVETRSPSKMMQELSAGLRHAGLNIFRHRRGMLFVSPIRARVFSHESAGVSASINAILQKVTASPGVNLKQLADQLAPAGAEPADHERARLSLASDLHWLVSEGYVIEFNDGSLDLPKAKLAPTTGEKPAGATDAIRDESTSTKPVKEKLPASETVEKTPVSVTAVQSVEADSSQVTAEPVNEKLPVDEAVEKTPESVTAVQSVEVDSSEVAVEPVNEKSPVDEAVEKTPESVTAVQSVEVDSSAVAMELVKEKLPVDEPVEKTEESLTALQPVEVDSNEAAMEPGKKADPVPEKSPEATESADSPERNAVVKSPEATVVGESPDL
jgi:hypothetical protein